MEIIAGDAIENLPADATLLWLFNPFTAGPPGRALMEELSKRLRTSYEGASSLRLVLYRPRHIDVFENDASWDVRFLATSGLFYRTAVVTRRLPG